MKEAKVCVFGDSIAKGIVYENNKFVQLQDSLVNLFADYYDIEVQNCSIFGQTLKRLEQKAVFDNYIQTLNKTSRNIAVIEIGGNDCDYNWVEVEALPMDKVLPKTPLKEFKALLKTITQKLIRHNVEVIFVINPPVDSNRYFNEVLAKRYNSKKILRFFHGDTSNISRHQECYCWAVYECAKNYGAKVLDARKEMLQKRDYLSLMCKDGVHPNAKGHKYLFNCFKRQIKLWSNK